MAKLGALPALNRGAFRERLAHLGACREVFTLAPWRSARCPNPDLRPHIRFEQKRAGFRVENALATKLVHPYEVKAGRLKRQQFFGERMMSAFNELRIRRLELLHDLNELEASVAELTAILTDLVEAESSERADHQDQLAWLRRQQAGVLVILSETERALLEFSAEGWDDEDRSSVV